MPFPICCTDARRSLAVRVLYRCGVELRWGKEVLVAKVVIRLSAMSYPEAREEPQVEFVGPINSVAIRASFP